MNFQQKKSLVPKKYTFAPLENVTISLLYNVVSTHSTEYESNLSFNKLITHTYRYSPEMVFPYKARVVDSNKQKKLEILKCACS